MSARAPDFTVEQWQAAVSACVPAKHRDLNLVAFDRGRSAAGPAPAR